MGQRAGATVTDPELLFGIEVDRMYDGYVALEIIALVKCVDENGEERWISRTSAGVGDPERFGILTFEAERIRDYQVSTFERDEDDE